MNTLLAFSDWSGVNDIPFVTRWSLEKIPQKEQTKKNSKPRYDSPPLSETSDDESNLVVSDYSTNFDFGMSSQYPQLVEAEKPPEIYNLLNALSTLSRVWLMFVRLQPLQS